MPLRGLWPPDQYLPFDDINVEEDNLHKFLFVIEIYSIDVQDAAIRVSLAVSSPRTDW